MLSIFIAAIKSFGIILVICFRYLGKELLYGKWHKTESKVLKYFDNVRHSSANPDEIVKMTNYSGKSDTLCELLTGFAFLGWSTVLESMVLSLPNVAWSLRFLQSKQNFLKTIWLLYCNQVHLHPLCNKCFCLLLRHYDPVWTSKA